MIERQPYISDDGERLPSVTELLPKQDYHCSDDVLENARIEGTVNHELIKKYLETGETYGDKYIEEFALFWENNKRTFGELLLSEKPLISKKYGFTGTPDIICEKCIIDIKRNFVNSKYHALQIAGYFILARENKIINTKIRDWVSLWYIAWNGNGVFKIRHVYDELAEKTFLCLVKKYQCQSVIDNYFKI